MSLSQRLSSSSVDERRPVTRSLSKQLGLHGGNPAAGGELNRSPSGTPHRIIVTRRRSASADGGGNAPVATNSTSTSGGANAGGKQGILRCVCEGFLLSPHDQLLECQQCRNWCHALCAGYDTRVTPLSSEVRAKFICPYCDGSAGPDGRKRRRDSHRATKPQPIQHLTEVPDRAPKDAAQLDHMLSRVVHWAKQRGYSLMCWPSAGQPNLTEKQIEQCLQCCKTSIADATFSESYPLYCFAEQRQQVHPYLQMAVLYHNSSKKIVSAVVSNGMDPYGNMKPTISGLKSVLSRGGLPQDSIQAKTFASVTDYSDFIHYTLVVTLDEFRGKSLAKALLLHESLRWLKRGRQRAFINMALAKRYEGKHIVYSVHPASQALYSGFGFIDVHPKFESSGADRYTKKEADMGRVLATVDARSHLEQVGTKLGIADFASKATKKH